MCKLECIMSYNITLTKIKNKMGKIDYREKQNDLNNERIILLYSYIIYYLTFEVAHFSQLKFVTSQLLQSTVYK